MFFGKYPDAIDPDKVGSYAAEAYSGGGYFYDEVLEYRVWTKQNGKTIYYAFPTYKAARKFSLLHKEAEDPVVLVKQYSYIQEKGNDFRQVDKTRVTEWDTSWLKGNKGTREKIPAFIAAHVGEQNNLGGM